MILIYNLRKSPLRFGELRRRSPGITPAILTSHLKELQEAGLVKRAEIGIDKLNGVEYSLTTKGESLKPIVYAMIRWGIANQKDYVLGSFGMDRSGGS